MDPVKEKTAETKPKFDINDLMVILVSVCATCFLPENLSTVS